MNEYSKPQEYTARVETIHTLNSNIYFIRLCLQDPPEIHFIAGQTVSCFVGGNVQRLYSIASPSFEVKTLELCIDVSPMGIGSKWFLGLNPGDPVQFFGPLGRFSLDPDSTRKIVMVATGAGIVPFRSMLLSLISTYDVLPKPISLYWGLRYENDIYWRSEFEHIALNRKNFRWTLVLSKPYPSWQGKTGHVTEHVFSEEQNYSERDFYLCGNRVMIEDMETKLLSDGTPRRQIHKDVYF